MYSDYQVAKIVQLLQYMRDNYPDINITYYFSDTGKELPEVYDFLYKLETYLGKPIKRLGQPRGGKTWVRF